MSHPNSVEPDYTDHLREVAARTEKDPMAVEAITRKWSDHFQTIMDGIVAPVDSQND